MVQTAKPNEPTITIGDAKQTGCCRIQAVGALAGFASANSGYTRKLQIGSIARIAAAVQQRSKSVANCAKRSRMVCKNNDANAIEDQYPECLHP